MLPELILLAGFLFAAHAIVANDSIQTLGTFFASNQHRPWWVIWLFVVGILWAVLLAGWFNGDVAYGRLDNIPAVAPEAVHWGLLAAPVVLLVLTRVGIPVSTTFLVLGVFADKALPSMIKKSLTGYVVAFVVALVLYRLALVAFERWSAARSRSEALEGGEAAAPGISKGWIVAQWLSTGFLWSQWLIQDLANIFVYLPRDLSLGHVLLAGAGMSLLYVFLCRGRGGTIQTIVRTKTNASLIPSATVIDFLFGLILLVFKEWSKVPMSTTWVFLGLLAGRQLVLGPLLEKAPWKTTGRLVGMDLGKATIGIVVSVIVVLLCRAA